MSRIKYELKNVSLFEKDDWNKMNQFLVSNLPNFEKALQPFIKSLK